MPVPIGVLHRAPEDETDPPMGEALTVVETARRFDVSAKTIYRQLWAGTFPCRAVQIGNQWRISRADVDDYLARRAAELGEVEG
jgi:excisionase family DNA binding protein